MCDWFRHEKIDFETLRKNAFNFRWAEVEDGIIPLTAADSDFPVAPEIQAGLIAYIQKGYFPYTPKLGMPELRESIARQLNIRKDEHVDPRLLLPIDSAARGMYVIAKTVLDPGDEMIVFDPVDFLFTESVRAAGAIPVLFPAHIKDDRIDLSALETYITPKTKMIGLCNPHNPYGTLYTKEDLLYLLDLAEKYDLYIMNDEIWSDIVYAPNKFLSILSVAPERNGRVLSIYGFSKAFSIAGLRAGCIYAAEEQIFDRLVAASDVLTTAGGISSLSQLAAQICMDQCYGWNEAFVAQMKENRDYALSRIRTMPGIRCRTPEATFLLFPDITETGMDSQSFADYLLKEAKLALVPGTANFFGPGAEGHVRICLATSREILSAGMDRLEKGLKRLMGI
ncbi:MAG: pyridoxal phosphate-dependent aminotransferase [Oscillospiraceae bacterium]|nr:pyridoxal phosphate-dependent aminotransferase [Oscillospiraceae bacterium]